MQKRTGHRPRQYGSRWYSGWDYRNGQPYNTYLSSRQGELLGIGSLAGSIRAPRFKHALAKIKKLVKSPSAVTALEIGPGDVPLISGLPFKKMVFLEASQHLAATLKKQEIRMVHESGTSSNRRLRVRPISKSRRSRIRVIAGDVRKLPFLPSTHFGLSVMNEVLTHIRPADRVAVVQRLIQMSDAMLIIDRSQASVKAIADVHFWQTKNEIRQLQATLVRVQPLIRLFERAGWEVKYEPVAPTGGSYSSYFILSAKRRS